MGLFSSNKKVKQEEPVKDKKQEKKERVYQDVYEKVKFVCHGGKVTCPFCSQPVGSIASLNPVLLQEKPYVTTGERNGKINLDFMGGVCSIARQSCKTVINLGLWKNYSEVHINDDFALLRRSTIPCLISGQDIRIVHSGQMALLTLLAPIMPKRLKIVREYLQIRETTVCHRFEYQAVYLEYGEEKPNDNIRWKIKLGSKEEQNLETIDEIIKTGAKLTGPKIHFAIPKEWKYESILLIAYLNNDEEFRSLSLKIQVKDHIVAAFFRIKNDKPKSFSIKKIEEAKGTFNLISEAPVHHHQGLFKYSNKFYISGSTAGNPSYIYQVLVDKEDQAVKFDNPLLLHKDIQKFKHPGGLQVANGILAVGIETYNILLLNTTTKKDSVVCFFDTEDSHNELKNLRITLSGSTKEVDEGSQSNFASAVGIVYCNNAWIVAVRGKNQDVLFYRFENKNGERKNKKTTKEDDVISHIGTVSGVAEFQNLNLFLDENNEIYLFGMGKSKMGGVDTCKIYRVNIKSAKLDAVWINEDGIIEYRDYKNFDQNKLIFTCTSNTSFHWASCVSIQKNPHTGVLDSGNEDPNFVGTSETGFLGMLTVYTVEGTVRYDVKEKITDNGWTEEYKQQYLQLLEESEKMGANIDWEEEEKYLEEISNHIYYEYTNPRINCNSFNE